MAHKFFTWLGALSFYGFVATNATAQIINTSDIDAICRSNRLATHRNTIVYVDLSSLRPGEDEWGYTILKKLELASREKLSVLGVNPSTFEVSEVFEACYPTFTQSEISQIRNKRTLWDKLITQDPETEQRDNLQTFDARLRSSLDKVVTFSKKYVAGKRRDVLGAIAVDKNRFKDKEAVYRVIIFTSGIISDDFEAGANEAQIVDLLTKKYPTAFSGAEISVFGVTGGDRGQDLESKEKVFSSFFLSNWARVRSFTPSLPQQTNNIFTSLKTRNGVFEGGGVKGSVKLSSSTADGKAADIWLTFLVAGKALYVPIEGDQSCSGDSCVLKGHVLEQIPFLSSAPYFRKGDVVSIAGKNGEKLVGTLTSESKEVFRADNGSSKSEDVKYQMEFAGD